MLSFDFPSRTHRVYSFSHSLSRPRSSSTLSYLERGPLRDIPISQGGAILGHRPTTFRPVPSFDKENAGAIVLANRRRRDYIISRLQALALQLSRARRTRRRTERSLRRLALRPVSSRADQNAAMPHPRLSMPEISDDSGSEPDLSILGMNRGRPVDLAQRIEHPDYDVHAQLEAEDTSIEDELIVEGEEGDHGVEEEMEDEEQHEAAEDEEIIQEPLADPASMGLKEISNLGRFTVSSHKQGNGVDELRNDDTNLYWQSDGPQPHKLTVYFVKRVGIRDLRFYVNYTEDESYTPTNIVFKSGTSENNLIEFAHLTLNCPVGWQQVPLAGAGGGPDGNTLVSYVLQMQILENHQNGKDTHLRGIKIYAFDVDSGQAPGRENNPVEDVVDLMDRNNAVPSEDRDQLDEHVRLSGLARRLAEARLENGESGFSVPDFMRDPEIR